MNILITGATGFIGSNICFNLLENQHNVYGICRDKSNFEKCAKFKDRVNWINSDKENWQDLIKEVHFELLIHSAWAGVSALERNDWDIQIANFRFSKLIFDFALENNIKKIISFGSQAEYGIFDHKVSEDFVPYPVDAYGAIKLMTLYYLRNLAKAHSAQWYWLRVFSLIGQNENRDWLLPKVVNNLLNNQSISLTKGEQFYDYMHMDDFLLRMNLIINSSANFSGVYNLCSGRSVQIRELIISIAKELKVSESLLNFGAIPYRENQNMFMVGSSNKFDKTFGTLSIEPLEETIMKIISNYKSN
jgi:nucleoside-diphosphate-sugar epimerase